MFHYLSIINLLCFTGGWTIFSCLWRGFRKLDCATSIAHENNRSDRPDLTPLQKLYTARMKTAQVPLLSSFSSSVRPRPSVPRRLFFPFRSRHILNYQRRRPQSSSEIERAFRSTNWEGGFCIYRLLYPEPREISKWWTANVTFTTSLLISKCREGEVIVGRSPVSKN